MESRNIKVTLEQAREWYRDQNSTLRELALSVYTEKELLEYHDIESHINTSILPVTVPYSEILKVYHNTRLEVIAKYLNGTWKNDINNTGYCINKVLMDNLSYFVIGQSQKIQYSGTVYFRSREDAKFALKILGEDVKYLF